MADTKDNPAKRARGDETDVSPTPLEGSLHDSLASATPTRNASAVGLSEMNKLDPASLAAVLHEVAPSTYGIEDAGEVKTFEFRRFLTEKGSKVSYWHDVPLHSTGGLLNAVIEIPRQTKAKMEMSTTEMLAPIKQDTKKGKLRDYTIPIEWNYGAFPQTWEQPNHVWEGLEGHAGDNDPVDCVDLSSITVESGSIIQVKPIAALAMIDEGEVDWKIIVINAADPLAEQINTLEDCERLLPGQVTAVREWFTWYKAVDENGARLPDKEPNVFGFDGAALSTEKALNVVAEAHGTWAALVMRKAAAGKLKLA